MKTLKTKNLREKSKLQFLDKLDTYDKNFLTVFGFILIAGLAVIDYLTGYEISFSFFYLIPVALIAWYSGKNIALVATLVSAVVWQIVNLEAGESFSHNLIPVWNALTRLGFFVIVAILLVKLKSSLQHESTLARTDFLTGAANPRAFYEMTEVEILRSKRYGRSLTLCYLDADNFKQINDTLGHQIGDELLTRVVGTIKQSLRLTDVVARIGGDEFAILLPETNQTQARVAVNKVRENLRREMEREKWAVTFSIGVLTCAEMPETVEQLIESADSLMYQVKNAGKDSVKFKEMAENIYSPNSSSVKSSIS